MTLSHDLKAEPSAARFRPGTAECKSTIPRSTRTFLLVEITVPKDKTHEADTDWDSRRRSTVWSG